MMKIIWIPQLATVNKKTGKIVINADSNMTIMNGIANSIDNSKYEISAIMPELDACNVDSYEEAITNRIKTVYQVKPHQSSFTLRYDFDFQAIAKIIEEAKPDFIVNNTSTLTRNIKAVLFSLGMKKTKLINFMHFLDLPGEDKVPIEISYFIRQIEGVLVADLPVFQSITVRDKTVGAIDKYFGNLHGYIDLENRPYTVWNATYSQDQIDAHKAPPYDKKTIVFPNRLSSTNYSNHERFFEAIRRLSKTRNDFQVIVNNPTRYMTYEEIREVCPNLLVLNDGELLNRQQYFEMINAADIGVALFTQEGHGGVSSKEFQAAGCLPVFPKVNEYGHLMPGDYRGYCDVSLFDLEDALNYALNVCRTEEGDGLVEAGKQLIYERDSFEFNIDAVEIDLEKLYDSDS